MAEPMVLYDYSADSGADIPIGVRGKQIQNAFYYTRPNYWLQLVNAGANEDSVQLDGTTAISDDLENYTQPWHSPRLERRAYNEMFTMMSAVSRTPITAFGPVELQGYHSTVAWCIAGYVSLASAVDLLFTDVGELGELTQAVSEVWEFSTNELARMTSTLASIRATMGRVLFPEKWAQDIAWLFTPRLAEDYPDSPILQYGVCNNKPAATIGSVDGKRSLPLQIQHLNDTVNKFVTNWKVRRIIAGLHWTLKQSEGFPHKVVAFPTTWPISFDQEWLCHWENNGAMQEVGGSLSFGNNDLIIPNFSYTDETGGATPVKIPIFLEKDLSARVAFNMCIGNGIAIGDTLGWALSNANKFNSHVPTIAELKSWFDAVKAHFDWVDPDDGTSNPNALPNDVGEFNHDAQALWLLTYGMPGSDTLVDDGAEVKKFGNPWGAGPPAKVSVNSAIQADDGEPQMLAGALRNARVGWKVAVQQQDGAEVDDERQGFRQLIPPRGRLAHLEHWTHRSFCEEYFRELIGV